MPVCKYCQLDTDTEHTRRRDTERHPLCSPCKELSESDPELHISPLDTDDLELVLAWRSNPEIYRYFREQDGPLDWSEHIEWFESRSQDRHDFVLRYEGRRVGVVTIDSDDAVGIYVGDYSARGHGVATRALEWICGRFSERVPLVAEIHSDNESSIRLFERCGFRQQGREAEWLEYVYEP